MRARRAVSPPDIWPAFTDFVTSVSLLLVALLLAMPWFFSVEALLPRGEEEFNPLRIIAQRQGDVVDLLVAEPGLHLDRAQIRSRLAEQTIVFQDEKGQGGILFVLGRADLQPQFRQRLEGLARVLAQKADWFQRIEVEGHSDDVPFLGGGGSNWRLSSERAGAVVEFLLPRSRIDPWKYSAKGFAEYAPVGGQPSSEHLRNPRGGPPLAYLVRANETRPQRDRNRRIEVRLIYADVEAPGGRASR